MNTYSIGEIAAKTGLSTHTLRFYEKEGLLPNIRKNSAGLRRFSEEDLNWLTVVGCLKSTGLPLKEIKHYLDLSQKGDETLEERLQIFEKQKNRLNEQIKLLQDNMEKINFKIKYYQEALISGEKEVYNKNAELKNERRRLFDV